MKKIELVGIILSVLIVPSFVLADTAANIIRLQINYVQNEPDDKWATEQIKTLTITENITSIRVYGDSDDGGYCYAS
ncbi:hypothetical protein KKG37_02455, partial [Patescibacteria group bacterium]|nr:hypothetical protein [Patescibacteria group bacterium]